MPRATRRSAPARRRGNTRSRGCRIAAPGRAGQRRARPSGHGAPRVHEAQDSPDRVEVVEADVSGIEPHAALLLDEHDEVHHAERVEEVRRKERRFVRNGGRVEAHPVAEVSLQGLAVHGAGTPAMASATSAGRSGLPLTVRGMASLVNTNAGTIQPGTRVAIWRRNSSAAGASGAHTTKA